MKGVVLLLLIPLVLAQTIVVYDGKTGKLAAGWNNFSWAKVKLNDTTLVAPGDTYSASMICAGWQGFYLSQFAPWDVSEYNTFSFWLNGGPNADDVEMTVQIIAANNSQNLAVTDYLPNHQIPTTWVQVSIPIASFGLITTQIKGFWFQANGKSGNPVVYFDDIEFSTSVVPPVQGPALTVDASKQTPISEGIYGATIFWSSDTAEQYATFVKEVRLPLNRYGGDGTTRYNWMVDSSNSGADWYFMGGGDNTNVTPGAWYDGLIEQNQALNVVSTVTIPMIQYINKEAAWHCSFPVSVYGNQSAVNPYVHPNGETCGNGVDPSGKNIVDKDPLATDVPNSPETQKQWVQHIVQKFGNSAKSGIIYQMDNEVSNWAFMHRDVHPQPVTYPEIVNQTILYASAVKEADATAKVAAPSEIQFAWYPDWGGEKNTIYFLQQIQAYEKQSGTKIVDHYDVHYPDANDNHWPKLTDVGRLRQTIDATYPGMGMSFSEWSLIGLGPLNGALATADEIGNFADYGAAWASIWGLSTTDIVGPVVFGLKIFRNYDGAGGSYGDNAVNSTSGDAGSLSIHAAVRSSDKSLTILVINKAAEGQTSTLTLSNFKTNGSSAKAFEYSAGNIANIVPLPDIAITSTGFSATFSPFSLTLVILPGA